MFKHERRFCMNESILDPQIWAAARRQLPLPMLMTKIGDGAFTKKGAHCPFCDAAKGKWGIYQHSGRWFFKCHVGSSHKHEPCIANDPESGHSEIGYLALRKGLSVTDAAKEFLRLALPEQFDRPEQKNTPEQPPEPPKPPPRDGPPKNIWHALWKRLPLTTDDHAKLVKTRGFSPETIKTLGFRSNNLANRDMLTALEDDYSLDELVSEGIFKAEGREYPVPAGQLFGYGITDRKDDHGKVIFEYTEPPIIPYLDADGVPFYLRPHKGGVKKPKDDLELVELDEEGETPDVCSAHVYCPYLLADLIAQCDGLCVFTEGEFKAAALWQCGIAAIACPGITFIRNKAFRDQLMKLLKDYGVTDLIVVFDNEVKNDPAFPKRYKPDPWKQWDTQVYAEYTARTLRGYFRTITGSCRLGNLPDELRIDGKADFDGILAGFVHGVEGHPVFTKALGIEEGTRAARKVFRSTINAATDQADLELFPSAARKIIECRVERLYHKPLVPFGSDREANLVTRLSEFDPETNSPIDEPLARIFRDLRGKYYKRGSVNKEAREDLLARKERISEQIAELREARPLATDPVIEKERHYRKLRILYGRLASIWERLKGIPEPLSNFTLLCEYKLHTAEGKVDRVVRIRDSKHNGRSAEFDIQRRIKPREIARLGDFREWCYGTGQGVWHGGEKDLQALVEDMDHHAYLRDIHEVPTYGWHEPSGIWFYGDCAFTPDYSMILPDEKSNIFWHDGVGYQIATSDAGDSDFCQKAPKLFSPYGAEPLEKPDVKAIFRKLSEDIFNTIGDFDGWIAVGLMLAYAIGPDLCKKGGHPGIWLTGRMSSGKTTVGRWLMRIWGFPELGGIKLGEKSSTAVGLNRGLTQYSILPLLLDEYRRTTIDPEKEEVLRGAFDRSGGLKGIADHSNRTRNPIAKTTPIVMGESSSGDSATRSRYAQIHVAIQKRIGDGAARFTDVQKECLHWYHVGRWLMQNRKEFREGVLDMLDVWTRSETIRNSIANDRVRLVYGVAYCCFYTAAAMLGTLRQNDAQHFQQFIIAHGERGLQDVIEETFLSQFWLDVITAAQVNAIPKRFFDLRYVIREPDGTLKQVDANAQGAIHVCLVAFNPVFDQYQQHKRKKGEDVDLSIGDIRRELEKEPYWLSLPGKAPRVHRIKRNGENLSCWAITLEKEPRKDANKREFGEPEFIFPFAQELIDAVEPKVTEE